MTAGQVIIDQKHRVMRKRQRLFSSAVRRPTAGGNVPGTTLNGSRNTRRLLIDATRLLPIPDNHIAHR